MEVLVEVHGAGNDLPTDPCDLAERFWEMGGTCTPRTVGGNTLKSPARACRNLGASARDSGHSRLPIPPAGMTA